MYMLLPMGIGATILATNPLILTLLAHYFLNEPASHLDLSVILITFLGIAVLSFGSSTKGMDSHNYKLGCFVGLLTSFCQATN
jgi:drug/metabolite transporter (DMT)-like permease